MRRTVDAGVIVCLLAILFGPIYTEAGYDWVRHSVSELAAQNTDNAWVMRLGLASLGSAAILGYFQERARFNIFFLVFGLLIALSALLPHKPFIEDRPYSELLDWLHSACASLGGFSAVAGFVLETFRSKPFHRKLIYGTIALSYTVLPLAMFAVPDYQGVFQRIIFVSFIFWVLIDRPGEADA